MKLKERHKAIKFRENGYSIGEISKLLNVSKSSVSLWVRNIVLSAKAIQRLDTKITQGQKQAAKNKTLKTSMFVQGYLREASDSLKEMKFDTFTKRLLCSLLYWCEGSKSDDGAVRFTNSDPSMIKTFLFLFRHSFKIDESKFRACIHLHSYHNPSEQKKFWSNLTGIPEPQFIKSFQKKNTGKRIKMNYPGCLQVRYYDSRVSRKLIMTARAFYNKVGA